MSSAVKEKIDKKIFSISRCIQRGRKHHKPSIRTKAMFYAMRFLQKHIGLLPADVAYWKKLGRFLGAGRPWKVDPEKRQHQTKEFAYSKLEKKKM